MGCKMIPNAALLTFYLVLLYGAAAEGLKSFSQEKEEVDKFINKHTLGTIMGQPENGDIYNCVDLYSQPARLFSMLKHNKIQMEPKFVEQNGLENGCPKGTIPIRRTTKEDLMTSAKGDEKIGVGVEVIPPRPPVTSGRGAKGN